MFVGDNKFRQRSGQSTSGNWQYQNRGAGSQQHTTAETVAAQDAAQNNRRRPLRTPIGGGGSFGFQGLWNPATTYATNAVVQLGSGTSSGLYLCLINSQTNPPDSGIGWVQMSSYATWL